MSTASTPASTLWQLIYTSHAAADFAEPELGRILGAAHVNNARAQITGVLLYSRGRFIQVLEGERGAVEATFERISDDSRHEGVRIVSARAIVERDFADWSMGFHAVSDATLVRHPQVRDLFDRGAHDPALGSTGSPARFLLLAFRELAASGANPA